MTQSYSTSKKMQCLAEDLRRWADILEETARLAPDVGTIFEYDGRKYRLDGWLKEMPPPPKPKNFPDMLGDILYQTQQDVGPDRKKLMFCTRRDAQYVSGAEVSGIIARIEDIKVVGRVNWPKEQLDSARDTAMRLVGEPVF